MSTHEDWPVSVGKVRNVDDLTYVHSADPGGFSVEDFRRIPDHCVELLDGVVVVRPAPTPTGLRMVNQIYKDFADGGCPTGYEAVSGPVDVQLGPATILRPEIVVQRLGDDDAPPALVVEIRPDFDRHPRWEERRAKVDGYRDAGVASYWVLNEETGNVRVYELGYRQRQKLVGFDEVCAKGRRWQWRLWEEPAASAPSEESGRV
jgi:hypothetical protein